MIIPVRLLPLEFTVYIKRLFCERFHAKVSHEVWVNVVMLADNGISGYVLRGVLK